MLALFCALGRFLGVPCVLLARLAAHVGFFADFWASEGALKSILERSGDVRGGFWRAQDLIFRSFFLQASLRIAKALDLQKPQFLQGFCWFFTHREHRPHAKKCYKNCSTSLSSRASHKDCAENAFRGSSDVILERSGTLLGSFWLALGRSWAPLDLSWASLGRILSASWAFLGVPRLVWV